MTLICSASACGSDSCDDLCTQTSNALRQCLRESPATWDDLDSTNRADFANTCTTRWGQIQSDLEARELEDALLQCNESLILLNEMKRDDTLCDQLRAIYIE